MHVLACLASLAGMASHNLARATKGPIFRRDEIAAGWLNPSSSPVVGNPFLFLLVQLTEGVRPAVQWPGNWNVASGTKRRDCF